MQLSKAAATPRGDTDPGRPGEVLPAPPEVTSPIGRSGAHGPWEVQAVLVPGELRFLCHSPPAEQMPVPWPLR